MLDGEKEVCGKIMGQLKKVQGEAAFAPYLEKLLVYLLELEDITALLNTVMTQLRHEGFSLFFYAIC